LGNHPKKATLKHGERLMALVHHVTAETAERATMELNVRQRLVVQRLGLAGPTATAALGQSLGYSASTMTGVVDRLEERGYIVRRPHGSDRRVIELALTAKGHALFKQELEFYRSLVEQTLAPLPSAERERVLRSFETLGPFREQEDGVRS